MIVVLDASGAVEIVTKTKYGIDCINTLMNADRVIAPDLYIPEISNVIWKIGKRHRIGSDICIEMANDCIDYIDEYVSASELWKESLLLAQKYGHSVYDMLYAVLAKRHYAILVTFDVRLRKICDEISVRCREMF